VVGSGTVHCITIVRDSNGGTIRYETFTDGRTGRGWHKTDPDWINNLRRTPQSMSSTRTAEQDVTSQEVKRVPGMIVNPYAQPQSSRRESPKESNIPWRQGSAAWIVNPYCRPGPAEPD
jgi:hypothetical protein